MARTDAGLRQEAEAREQMVRSGLPHTSIPMRQPSLSAAQQSVVWKMQHGRQLVKHPMHCGDPSSFWLSFPDQTGEKADKRTVDALIKRGFIVFSERRDRFAIYRLTALGRQVVCNG
jgi:hypothetical protein